jgi:hypothetical protein
MNGIDITLRANVNHGNNYEFKMYKVTAGGVATEVDPHLAGGANPANLPISTGGSPYQIPPNHFDPMDPDFEPGVYLMTVKAKGLSSALETLGYGRAAIELEFVSG